MKKTVKLNDIRKTKGVAVLITQGLHSLSDSERKDFLKQNPNYPGAPKKETLKESKFEIDKDSKNWLGWKEYSIKKDKYGQDADTWSKDISAGFLNQLGNILLM